MNKNIYLLDLGPFFFLMLGVGGWKRKQQNKGIFQFVFEIMLNKNNIFE
jgi:hypothetical protein